MEAMCKRYTVYLFGSLRSTSPRILHPDSDEFFWYHNLEIPELVSYFPIISEVVTQIRVTDRTWL